jgi:hypothetical protein
VYGIIELNNELNDKNIQLETNIAQIGFSKQAMFNRPNEFMMTVSTRLLDDIIKEDYFTYNM